jgi:hypothetical protein
MEQNRNFLDVAPQRRQPGSMVANRKPAPIRDLDRINLRLSAETFDLIDDACASRPGNVSRNTWIAEAVEEKLAREQTRATHADNDRPGDG